ncbi:DUF2333 family protein [Rhizobiaceae bacterium n13]|uniref:DUF2333 family protein n=1 Tax=Ferirhizobium litorale TaxID=2927786 RepID=A0AAE3QD12_9HYPH|nr:DUF2333 family protein [Fererhizobium litorale]MDI7860826.1 DUF2333 family protein [Fererhizobium litorale]MDI7920974.1 DUF2333 family protein [Fererhizobium litorale]
MLDPIIAFFKSVLGAIGRGIGVIFAGIFWPFRAAHGWYRQRSWIIKGPILLILVALVGLYGYFVWQTQVWTNFDPNFVDRYKFAERNMPAGQELPATAGQTTANACQSSGIAEIAAELTDFNVNQNAWISSMLLYRLGFFGIEWDHTPFLDNKAAFQRGVNQAVRRTSVELVDTLGRMRGTSGINQNLQDARGNIQFDEYTWYFGFSPFGPKTPTPSFYRAAIRNFRAFNDQLSTCGATFDTRADNLLSFIDRIANDLGNTASILRERSENYNAGWFDTRADDRFWFAYGQLYGYYAILTATGADFQNVINERNIAPIYAETLRQFEAALRITPWIISNGREDGWIMPTHLATMGFYILRARSNLVEVRSILDR